MNRIKKSSLFLLAFLVAGSANIACYAAEKEQIDQLQDQMNTFSKRVRVYLRCLKGKCTQEETQAAGKEAIEDGKRLAIMIFVVLPGAVVMLGVSVLMIGGLVSDIMEDRCD